MTTIVYRDGCLAADSRATTSDGGWTLHDRSQKVWKHTYKDGKQILIGITGNCAEGHEFVRWIMDGGDPNYKPKSEGSRIVVIWQDDEGNAMAKVYETGGHYEVAADPFLALGGGYPSALGALHMGANAIEAIEIAKKIDPATGGPVQWVRFGDSPARVPDEFGFRDPS